MEVFGRYAPAAVSFVFTLLILSRCSLAETFSIRNGTSIIGIPNLSEQSLSSCGLLYLNSSYDHTCRYDHNGHIVFFNSLGITGVDPDCGSNYFSSANMQQGLGYFVRTSNACEVTLPLIPTIDVTLVKGMNIISVPVRTTVDDIARYCGDKTKIVGYFNSSSNTSCRYDRNGYFVKYDSIINNTGDCKSNYVSDDSLEPFVGYFVRFMGKNGDGVNPCTIRYQNGQLVTPPQSTTTSTTSVITSTTAIEVGRTYYIWSSGSSYYANDTIGNSLYAGPSASAAIQKAIDSAPSGYTVFIASGTYIISSRILVTKSLSLVGQGQSSTIIQAGNILNNDLVYVNPSTDQTIRISNIKFDGRRGYGQIGAGHGIQARSGSLICDRITVVNTWGSCVATSLSQQNISTFQVTNSRFDSCGNHVNHTGPAVRADASSAQSDTIRIDRYIVENNNITNCNEHGIKAYPNSSNKAIIRNNYIENVSYQGIYICVDSEIVNNTIVDAGMLNGGNAGGIFLQHGGIQFVAGNRMSISPSNSYGMRIDDGVTSEVEGNTIQNAKYGILTYADNGNITGNNISYSRVYGVWLTGDSNFNWLVGNSIVRSGTMDIRNDGIGNIISIISAQSSTTTIKPSTTTISSNPSGYAVAPSGTAFTVTSPAGSVIFTGNATTAIQKAFDSSSGGDTVVLKAGTYILGKTVKGKSGVSLKGEKGAIVSLSGLGVNGDALDFSGTTGSSTTLSTQGSRGAASITVSSSSGMTTGGLVFIYNTNVEWKGNTRHQKQGEIRSVKSVGGTVISLTSPLEDTYAAGSAVMVINPVKDFEVSGLTFNGVQGRDQYGITVAYGQNVRIHDSNFSYCQMNGIGIRNVIDSEVYNNRWVHSDTAGYGYGLSIAYASQNISVHDNLGDSCRHTIAIGGGSLYGIPRHIFLHDNNSTHATQQGFDCHPNGEDINYVNNTSILDTAGITVSMFSGRVEGNLVLNSLSTGIAVHNLVGSDIVVIRNNTIIGCHNDGIESKSKNVQIAYNYLDNCNSGPTNSRGYASIALLHGSGTDNDVIVYNYSADNCTIYGNIVTNSGGAIASPATYAASGVVGTTYAKPS
jgi:hypothetical protein